MLLSELRAHKEKNLRPLLTVTKREIVFVALEAPGKKYVLHRYSKQNEEWQLIVELPETTLEHVLIRISNEFAEDYPYAAA